MNSRPSLSADAPTEQAACTVSELVKWIQEALARALPARVWVTGEVANLTRSNAGHIYLDLVERGPEGTGDDQVLLHAVIWESRKLAINQALREANWGRVSDGDEIKVRVGVEFYPPQGKVTLQVYEVDPHYTLGRWKQEREKVVAVLREEGVLERNKQLHLPVAPYRVGLITSAKSNAHADFMTTLSDSGLGWQVDFHHSGVQGDAARAALTGAVRRLSEIGPDVICIVRGGGATTDLAVFDHVEVARSIAHCPVPVITGIGHELDRTVTDLVAHRSERTPTACAGWLVGRVRGFADRVYGSGREIAEAADGLVRRHRRRLDGSPAEVAGAVDRALSRRRQQLDKSVPLLPACVRPHLRAAEAVIAARRVALVRDSGQSLSRERSRLGNAQQVVEAYDPRLNLVRGWSITRHRGGGVISSISQIGSSETIETWLSDGTVVSTVSETLPDRAP